MSAAGSEVYEFDRFRLDAAHSMLYRDGHELRLPPKAVETLAVLVARRGEILSKDELMAAVWPDSIVEESNLSQYLHILRKALGKTREGKPAIETLRRRGYRFVLDVRPVPASIRIDPEPAGEAAADRLRASYNKQGGSQILPSNDVIGRESDIAEIIRLLGGGGARLLTLTGVGGVGKTTLARAVLEAARDNYADGAAFVELAAVSDPERVVPAIASELGVKEATNKTAFEILKEHVRTSRMLLVLDNFEQVAEAAPFVAKLLDATRNLRIVVTSRILLRVKAEREFPVAPLGLPVAGFPRRGGLFGAESGVGTAGEGLMFYPAVQLFVARARRSKPSFSLTDENAAAVAELSRRLEGLPLAIELAAARTKLMSPKELLARLESRLMLLTGGPRDAPARQQTMHGTVEWSYSLLDSNGKSVFRRLSVFAGGFTMDVAEFVCGRTDEGRDGPEGAVVFSSDTDRRFDVIDGVTSLIDSSLLGAVETADGGVRFRMLEVVREYAWDALRLSGEMDAAGRRHAEYFLRLGEAAEPHLKAAQSAQWLNLLEEEHDNLRVALRWAMEHDVTLGQRLASSIWRFWWLHGYVREACEQLGAFLSHPGPEIGNARSRMLLGAAFLNRLRGNFEESRLYAGEALENARRTGDKESGAQALYQLGLVRLDDSDFAGAEELFNEGLTMASDSGDKQTLGLLLNGLGEAARLREDYERAADFYRRALEYNREAGDLVRQTTNLINLGTTALSQDDLETAASFYEEGLRISSGMADTNGRIYCLEGLAGAYWAVHDPERAAVLFGAAASARAANNLFLEPADRPAYDRSIERLRTKLPEDQYSKLFAQGSELSLEDAVVLAFQAAATAE